MCAGGYVNDKASLERDGGSDDKESVCNVGDLGLIPGWERSLEKGTAAHCRILTWRIPWTEESGRPHSMGLQRVRHD